MRQNSLTYRTNFAFQTWQIKVSGCAENDGQENDGHLKSRGWKMKDMEFDGQKFWGGK
jgi:hypothetical protein